jgi:hypothetical protein
MSTSRSVGEDFFLRFSGTSTTTGGGESGAIAFVAERVFFAGESGGDSTTLVFALFWDASAGEGVGDGLRRHRDKPLDLSKGGGGVMTMSSSSSCSVTKSEFIFVIEI